MNLLFPLGLAALATMVLPLLIHLARRDEQRPVDFAALRWLRQRPRPRHRPKFDELVLLTVRLLLIALVAVLLARPALFDEGATQPVVAIAPGVDPATLPAAEGRRIWLAPDFPSLDTPAPGAVPIASLIRQLDADLPPGTPLTLIVPAILTGVDAERPRLSRPVVWRVVPGTMPPAPAQKRTLRVALRTGPEPHDGARHIRAALTALGKGGDVAPSAEPIPEGVSALVLLAAGPLPAATRRWVAAGGTALVGNDTIVPAGAPIAAWRDVAGATLVETQPLGRGRLFRFTRALTSAAMPVLAEPDFPYRLAALLAPDRPSPGRVFAEAYRPITGAPRADRPARDLAAWFAIAIAALWLVERWLATSPRRRIAA